MQTLRRFLGWQARRREHRQFAREYFCHTCPRTEITKLGNPEAPVSDTNPAYRFVVERPVDPFDVAGLRDTGTRWEARLTSDELVPIIGPVTRLIRL